MPTVLRTNYCTNPNLSVNTNSWNYRWNGPNSAAATFSATATGGAISGGTLLKTWTSTGQVGRDNGFDFNRLLGVVLGDIVTISAYMKTNRSDVQAEAVIEWNSAPSGGGADATISSTQEGYIALPANTWTRLSVTGTAPATARSFRSIFSNYGTDVNWSANDTFQVSNLLIEKVSTLKPYFDGDTAATAYKTHSWTNTAEGSTSTESSVLSVPASQLSLLELRQVYYAHTLGVPVDGSVNDLYKAFLQNKTGMTNASVSDMEIAYYKSLSGLSGGSDQDYQNKIFNPYQSEEKLYLASFFS
jgi:hypothetical protein